MTTVTLKELRPMIPKLINDIDRKFERVLVTKRGHSVAVMMSVDDYESLIETVNVLADKAGMARIKKGIREIKNGKTVGIDDLRKKIEHV